MLLTHDPVTKITRRIHFHEPTEEFMVSHQQDDKEILEGNEASYNSYDRATARHAADGDFYARIPLVVWGRLLEQGIAQDPERFRKWLNDPDNRVFRRRPGKI